ncbi:hypothetical protein EV363DRAFT_1341106, partial [Boletus edulis]
MQLKSSSSFLFLRLIAIPCTAHSMTKDQHQRRTLTWRTNAKMSTFSSSVLPFSWKTDADTSMYTFHCPPRYSFMWVFEQFTM